MTGRSPQAERSSARRSRSRGAVLVLLGLAACSHDGARDRRAGTGAPSASATDPRAPSVPPPATARAGQGVDPAAPAPGSGDASTVFSIEREDLRQVLEVWRLGERRLRFVATQTSPCRTRTSGVASAQGATEDWTDEQGAAFPVQAYVHRDGKCELVLKVEDGEEGRAVVIDACPESECRFVDREDAILRRMR